MPIYEYQCQACHHHFDLIQKINDEPVKQCPQCLENAVIRLVSAAGFQLKGSGWYATDFKDKGKKPEAKQENTGSQDKKTSTDTTKSSGSSTTSKGEKD